MSQPEPEQHLEQLLEQLHDAQVPVRLQAARALALYSDERATSALLTALDDPDQQVSFESSWSLAQRGDTGVHLLIELLKEKGAGWEGRHSIIGVLGLIGEPAVPPLITLLQGPEGDLRETAAIALGNSGDARAVEALNQAVEDESAELRERAVIGLGFLGSAHGGMMRRPLDNENQASAKSALIQALGDSDSAVRFRAAVILGGVAHDQRAVGPLIQTLQADHESFVREAAAEALGWLRDARAVEPLIRALQDDSAWQVREKAARSLGQLGEQRAVEPLIRALQDTESSLRSEAAEALGFLRDERAREPLRQALNDEDPFVYSSAAEALAHFGELGPLIAGLRHENVGVRLRAAEALQWAGTEQTLPLLRWVAEHDPYEAAWFKDDTVREVAAYAVMYTQQRQQNALI